jgi:hypothetical protein
MFTKDMKGTSRAEHSSCSLIRGRKLQFSRCAGVRWSKPLTSAIITHAKLPTERQRESRQTRASNLTHANKRHPSRLLCVSIYAHSLSRFYVRLSSKARSSLTCFDIGWNNNLSCRVIREAYRQLPPRLTWAIWAPVSEKWCVCLCPGRYDATAGWFLGSLWSVARVTRMCAAPQHTPNDRKESVNHLKSLLHPPPGHCSRLSLRKLSLSASPKLQGNCLLFISLGDAAIRRKPKSHSVSLSRVASILGSLSPLFWSQGAFILDQIMSSLGLHLHSWWVFCKQVEFP